MHISELHLNPRQLEQFLRTSNDFAMQGRRGGVETSEDILEDFRSLLQRLSSSTMQEYGELQRVHKYVTENSNPFL